MKRIALALGLLTVWAAPLAAQTAEEKRATVAFVQRLQAPDGGFPPAPSGAQPQQSSLRASLGAIRALKYFGGEPRDREACTRFVSACYDKETGGFADRPGGKAEVIPTAVGLMVVVELRMPREKYEPGAVKFLGERAQTFEEIRLAAAGLEAVGKRPPQATEWLDRLIQMRNADGSYGTGAGAARDTGGSVVAVLRLGGKVLDREKVLQILRKGQRPDGGFGKPDARGSDLETTYRVLRAFVMLKERPEVAKCQAFVARCRNDDGGYGVLPGEKSTVAATYFAGIIQHWLADK